MIDQLVPTQNGYDMLKQFQTDHCRDSCLSLIKEMEAYGEALKELALITDYNNPAQVAKLDEQLTIAKNLFDKIKKSM